VFKREIQFGDVVTINLKLKKCTQTYSRWTIEHEIIKNNETLSAIVTVDGAWLDTNKRRLTVPPTFVADTFQQFPRSVDFTYIERKNQ